MNEEIIRKMPSSLIAEQSLLGSILIDPDAFNEIADAVSSTDFYITEHTQIYLAMRELFITNSEIDIVTLIDALVRKGIYDKSGGEDYIRTLTQVVPNALNVKDYAKIVKEKSILRGLITACGEISDVAYREHESTTHIIDYAENKIFEIAQGRDSKNFRHIRDVLTSVYENLQALSTNAESVQTTKTGFSGLDAVLSGMGKSDLVIVGARPGMGKTSFVLNIGTNVAIQTKKKVCIFSLEMSSEQLVSRILSSEAMIDSYAMRSGNLKPEEWDQLAEAAARLAGSDILIDDTPGITATDMKAKLRRVDNLGLVIIDYLQLMQGESKSDNRAQEMGDISRAMKLMAKELMVPVICCAQLNRSTEQRTGNKRPMPSDLRDSGAIEQDADVILFLYRDEYYKQDSTPVENEGNICEVIVAKNRHGSTGTVKMGWIGRYTKFRSIANENEVAGNG